MRDGFHERSIEAIIEEIKFLNRNYNINHFQFADELLMSSKGGLRNMRITVKTTFKINGLQWEVELCEDISIRDMKKSGVQYINYGIESLNQSILNQMERVCRPPKYTRAWRHVDFGISRLNFIWGFPGDTKENLFECVNFLKKYDLAMN